MKEGRSYSGEFFNSLLGGDMNQIEKLSKEERFSVMNDAAEFIAFMASIKADINNPLSILQSASGRTYLADLLDALCAERQTPLVENQRRDLLALLEESARDLGSLESLSLLEVTIARRKTESRIGDSLKTLLTADQAAVISGDHALWDVTGGLNQGGLSTTSIVDLKTSEAVGNWMADYWNKELRTNDSEALHVRSLSTLFGAEYAQLNRSMEERLGAQMVQKYFQGLPATGESEKKTYGDIEISILELQLRYQRELIKALGSERATAIQNMSTTLMKFPEVK